MINAQRILTILQAFLKSYGPSPIKKVLWDKEYSGSKWNFADNTVGDCVYPYLERYGQNGSILDLGCGSGNTATELAATAYHTYLGVDISKTALDKAMARTEATGRAHKNRFACADFLSYVPTQQFDVILFRESMYHVPLNQVKAILDQYSTHLKDGGVFIVRMKTSDSESGNAKSRPRAMISVIETEFDVVEKSRLGEQGATVIVFRHKAGHVARIEPLAH